MIRKLSKNMSPNSRPPLTSRIRSSFESKRSKSEVSTPSTNGIVAQDPDALRQAIEQAINSETFLNAISANLANLIKPSIKTALDTIQPVVETVYNHEVLLRKTNQSVEDLLERFDSAAEGEDESPSSPATPRKRAGGASIGSAEIAGVKNLLAENNTHIEAKWSELSKSVDTSNNKIAESVEGINAALWPTREALDSLKSSSEHSNTTMSVMQAQLDQLNADVGVIMDSIGSDLGNTVKSISQSSAAPDTSLLSSHTTKLDAISTDLAALKGHADTVGLLKDISTKLDALRENLLAGIASSNENFTTITPQIGSVLAAVETYSTKLAEINPADSQAEVLAAVQKSNDSHAAHSVALGEIKERGTSGSEPAPASSNPETVTALETLAKDLASVKENIQAGFITSNENISNLGIKVDDVLTTLEAHRAADSSGDILVAVQKSNDSHAAHAEALDGLKSVASAPSADRGISDLEPQFATILAKLDTHSAALNELKPSHVSPGTELATMPSTTNLDDIEAQISLIADKLESHTSILNEIKDDVSAEILTVLHDINEAHSNQNTVLSEIRESDVSEEILTALHASNDSHTNHANILTDIHTAVKSSNDSHISHSGVLGELKETLTATTESHATHTADLAEIKEASKAANDLHASHITALTELKASPSTGAAPALERSGGDLRALETHINTIISTLDTQNATLSDIKEATASPEVFAVVKESQELLKSHTPILTTIKDSQSHEDILANLSDLKAIIEESRAGINTHGTAVKELHDTTKASHAEITQAIGTLVLGGAAGAGAGALVSKDDDSSADILEEVKAVRAIVDKFSSSIETVKDTTTSMAAQIDINHTTVTTSITTLSDELKSEIDSTGTDITTSIANLSGDVKNIDLEALKDAVEASGKEIKGLSVLVEGVDGTVKSTGTHVVGLIDGVHLNQKGLGQLKEHVASNIPTAHSSERQLPAKEVEQVVESDSVPEAESLITQEPKVVKDASEPEPETPRAAEPETKEPESEPKALEAQIEEKPTPTEEPEAESSKEEPILEEPIDKDPNPTPSLEEDDDESTLDTESASTSAIASPLSPSFPGDSKKGKKGKKEKKDKKPKKDKKAPFVFDPDEEEDAA